MNAPYSPSSFTARLGRQIARFAARRDLPIHPDHAIVSFSFDDFPKTAATMGAPALEKRGWRGTYYASAGLAGTCNHHGPQFDAGDIVDLSARGHEIGCHTFEHMDCAQAGVDEIATSLERNAAALQAMGLSDALSSFAFPYGETSLEAKRALAHRFASMRGVRAEINRGSGDLNLLRAVPIDGGEAGIARAVEAAESLVQAPGWLIYYAHDIQDDPTEWGCTPGQFERVCEAVAASGARVMPVRDALKALQETPA
ncbi:polysaccharide deacetylase family protein [Maricaulis sp.]|uniref:polysaccharide deacetylase family protein n=1 Tax=Maricaulis sp. TaxID=1486257 RepID=UPI0026330328|nr:polysaccharide deacetylase family protein [Maricaulis sp.]